ncbi:unnamed protein product [Gadus morhua 'NCC']
MSKKILRVIVKDMRPLSLVEGEAFIDIIEYACPGFKCPSRSWFTKQLEKAYQHALEDLKKDLKKRSSKITLTTDAWTKVTNAAKHYLDMKSDQLRLLEELQQALEPFEQATVFLSGEAYVTVSVLPPLVWKIEATYNEDGKNVCIFAAALDPRFRKLKFLSTEDILKVKLKLQTLVLEARRVQVREEPEEDDGDQPDHSRQKAKTVLDMLLGTDDDEELEDEDPGQDGRDDDVRNELLAYFREKQIPKDKNPLQ